MSAKSSTPCYMERARNLLKHRVKTRVPFYSNLQGGQGHMTHAQVEAMKDARDKDFRINQPMPGKKTATWRYVKVAA